MARSRKLLAGVPSARSTRSDIICNCHDLGLLVIADFAVHVIVELFLNCEEKIAL